MEELIKEINKLGIKTPRISVSQRHEGAPKYVVLDNAEGSSYHSIHTDDLVSLLCAAIRKHRFNKQIK